MALPELTYDTPVRSAHWYPRITASVFTVAGYAARYNEDVTTAVLRAIERGHELVGTIYSGAVLVGDPAEAAALLARDMALAARAVTLAEGDQVLIDGKLHVVHFPPGNEKVKAPRNSDPIHFQQV
jgi:hypothetical protein